MSKFPWKTTLAGAAILAATVYAFGQMSPSMHGGMGPQNGMGQMHQQMMRGQMQGPGGMQSRQHGAMHGAQFGAAGVPAMPGQDAFGAIQEVVQLLEADPATDWSKVNIAALREHLIDMNEVTLHASSSERMLDNGIEIVVTGEGRTLAAVKRMVPAHVHELSELGWNAKTEDMQAGVRLTVTTTDAQQLAKLKALGFIGIMVQGSHHRPHHLLIATGQLPMH